jgi:hypothetical protein
MTFITNRRVVATIAAATCIAVTASASAGALPSTDKSDAAQSAGSGGAKVGYPPNGFNGGDIAQPERTAKSTYPPNGFNGGDIAQPERIAKSTYPPNGVTGGDHPADRPGGNRAPAAAPSTTEVVRPERTIVRNVDEALPLILSGSALLLVLAGIGITLIRTGMVPRPGRSD